MAAGLRGQAAETLVLDDDLMAMIAHPSEAVEKIFIFDALGTTSGNASKLAAARGRPLSIFRRTVLLVDYGVRTGGTTGPSINAVPALSPSRIV